METNNDTQHRREQPPLHVRYVEIDAGDWRFQPRVAAVCVWRNHVLLQGALDGDFWVLPGGRVLPLEVTPIALQRTLGWEWAQDITVGQLLWVMEYVTTVGGRPTHELGFYYSITLPDTSPYLDLTVDHAAVERGHDLLLRWFPVDDVPDLRLFPEFLRTALRRLPEHPIHIVQVDTEPSRSG